MKQFIIVLCLLGLATVHCKAQEKKAYNVLFLLVDDLRPTIGAYGDPVAHTPAMDELGTKAHVFRRAYTNQAVCVASRYNLLLGSRSTSTGLYDFGRAFREAYPEAITLPQHFKNNGYHTEAIGKVFHIGHNTYNDEQSWSIPHHHELVIEYADKSKKGQTREEALFANIPWGKANSLAKGAAWECLDVPDETYADGRVAKYATERLKELSQERKPFFLAVGFARPHLPFSVPKKYWDMYEPHKLPMPSYQSNPINAPNLATKRDGEISQYLEIPAASVADPFPDTLTRKLIHGYYAGVSYVDAQIGKVMKALSETGLDKNTIVVLWGDHGYLLGEMGMWTKHVNYELANRIPLIIKHPDIRSGVQTDALIETVDIYPTLAELCQLPTPVTQQPFDGKSYKNFLFGDVSSTRKFVYHSFPRDGKLGRAIRNADYRLVEWKAIGKDEEAIYELYKYSEDNIEKENIYAPNLPIVRELKNYLNQQPQPHAERVASKWKEK